MKSLNLFLVHCKKTVYTISRPHCSCSKKTEVLNRIKHCRIYRHKIFNVARRKDWIEVKGS